MSVCHYTYNIELYKCIMYNEYTLYTSIFYDPLYLYESVDTGCCGVIWCLIFIGHFQQKSPMIGGSFAKKDLQLKASHESSPPCRHAECHPMSTVCEQCAAMCCSVW